MTLPERVLALDVETSGLVSRYDQITEIGCAVMEGGAVQSDPFQSRVRLAASQKISLDALAVQAGDLEDWKQIGKSLKALYDAPQAKDVVQELASWSELTGAKDLPVVTYNAAFDWSFVAEKFGAFSSIGGHAMFSPVWICAMVLFTRVVPGKRANLDLACRTLGIPEREGELGHSALQDAIKAGQVYEACRQRLQ